jgi:hypothetical protein
VVAALVCMAPAKALAQYDSSILGPYESLYADEWRTSPDGRYKLYFQSDGNLTLTRDDSVIWATGPSGPGGRVDMQGDGNLVVLDETLNAVWTSNTWGYPGAHLEVSDAGGAIVLSPSHEPLWSTNTWEGMIPPQYQSIEWATYAQSHHPALQECVGNCGAGCSDANNPCGGSPQHWTFELLTAPEYQGTYDAQLMCSGDHMIEWGYQLYGAVGRWTYHGWASTACQVHDFMCGGGSLWLGCLAWLGCSDGWDQEWSYDEYVSGFITLVDDDYGPSPYCVPWAASGA